MIKDNIKLGLIDVFRNKVVFCLMLLLIFSLGTIVESATDSYLRNKFKEFQLSEQPSYSAVVLQTTDDKGYDYSNTYGKKLDDIFSKNGHTYTTNSSLCRNCDTDIIVLYGKFNKNTKSRVFWLVGNKNVTDLKNEAEFEVVSHDAMNYDMMNQEIKSYIDYDKRVLLEIKSDKYKNVSGYKFRDADILDLIENAKFSEDEINKGVDREFEKIFDGNKLMVINNTNKKYDDDENTYIFKYIVPYCLITMGITILSFVIFFKYMLKSLQKEYKIHILSGARTKDIMTRNSVFVVLVNVAAFCLLFVLNGFAINTFSVVAFIYMILCILILEIIMYLILKKSDLIDLIGD
ncbi:hypothetical protein GKF99_04245 [Finegoldia sp. BIOML-A2]|uniref:hypothetical protein n=1 Tax=unclassified Finegoldia TaxID=2619637 RepID=UPI0012AFE0B6|nr:MULTISPECIES: hypothetical protein [unclassified Finegoldia]MSA97300.1 hypothetical protein [Finegoldia sp. BIOML-A5]MSB00626.1 hypothetical protein [Finegoldia sp. BIOML-A2]